jgi:DNA polymerase III epsilon subunit-like protein
MFYAIVLKYCQRVFKTPYLKVKPSFAGNAVLFLILDIETTGLSPKSDYIIQLAAKVLGSDKGFCKYIQPPIKLPKNIESMTGITDDFLRRGGIDHVTGYHYNSAAGAFIDVYNDFCAFCREVSQREGKPLVMVAHNSAFELRMINSEIKRVIAASINKSGNVSPFSCLSQDTGIISVVDSLALLRTKQLWRSDFTLSTSREKAAPLPESFSLDTIYQHIFGRGILNGHNAVADVLALEKILSSPSLNDWKPLAEKMQQSLVLHNYN